MTAKRRSTEDILNPERLLFRMIKDYVDGKLTHKKIFYRAIVEDVSRVAGDLEANPPCPVGSIRARIYTNAIDANIPKRALSIFYPFFPPQTTPTVEIGEHVYVAFEDDQFSNGFWMTQLPVFGTANFSTPDLPATTPQTTAAIFNNNPPETTVPADPSEFGTVLDSQAATRTRETAQENQANAWEGKRILLVGDSQMAGLFGSELERVLREHSVSSVARYGRSNWSTISWNRGKFTSSSPRLPTLSELIQTDQPDVVIILLGGNDAASSHFRRSDYRETVLEFWDQAQGKQRIWIGPPSAVGPGASLEPDRETTSNLIKSIVGANNFVDSISVTQQNRGRGRDGVHFTRDGLDIIQNWIGLVVNR